MKSDHFIKNCKIYNGEKLGRNCVCKNKKLSMFLLAEQSAKSKINKRRFGDKSETMSV